MTEEKRHKSQNITEQQFKVTSYDRQRLNNHPGFVVWFTGLSASGKTTLARELDLALYKRRCRTYILDGDNIRHGLNRDLGFSPEDRAENIRRIGEVAHLFADSGSVAIAAFISPYRNDRRDARESNPPGRFIEVFCKCSIEECEARDPKGLYKKARAGKISEFTGISAPYEDPPTPEIIVETDKHDVAVCIDHILAYLEENDIIPLAE